MRTVRPRTRQIYTNINVYTYVYVKTRVRRCAENRANEKNKTTTIEPGEEEGGDKDGIYFADGNRVVG